MSRALYPYLRRLRHAAPETLLVVDRAQSGDANPALIFYNGTKEESRYVAQAFEGLMKKSKDLDALDSFTVQPVFFRNGNGAAKDIFMTDGALSADLIKRNKPHIYYSLFPVKAEQLDNLLIMLSRNSFLNPRFNTNSLEEQRKAIISKYYHFRGEAKPAFDTEFTPETLQKGMNVNASRIAEVSKILRTTFAALVSPKYFDGLQTLEDKIRTDDVQKKKDGGKKHRLTHEQKQAVRLVEISSPQIARTIRSLTSRVEAQLLISEENLQRLIEVTDLLERDIPEAIRVKKLGQKVKSVVSDQELDTLKEFAVNQPQEELPAENVLGKIALFEEFIQNKKHSEVSNEQAQGLYDLYGSLADLSQKLERIAEQQEDISDVSKQFDEAARELSDEGTKRTQEFDIQSIQNIVHDMQISLQMRGYKP